MTPEQLHIANVVYLVQLIIAIVLTRATARRVVGALVGGVVFGVVSLGIVAFCLEMGWWRMAIPWEPYFLTLLALDSALWSPIVYLIDWRVARRFGWRGLAVVVAIAAILGPVRDYSFMAAFPEWGAYAPGIAPALAVAAFYITMVVLGHAVMWLVAGPSRADRLARRPWESAPPTAAVAPSTQAYHRQW